MSEEAADEGRRIADLIEERGRTHGNAHGQHVILAQLWNLHREHSDDEISPADAMFMELLIKVSRIFGIGELKREHVEDIVGYGCLILAEMNKSDAPRPMTDAEREVIRLRRTVAALQAHIEANTKVGASEVTAREVDSVITFEKAFEGVVSNNEPGNFRRHGVPRHPDSDPEGAA
jgi:hypothetical protein